MAKSPDLVANGLFGADRIGAADAPVPFAGDGHGAAVLVLVGAVLLAAWLHRRTKHGPAPPASFTCAWRLAGRDSERLRWIWHCSDCGGIGSGKSHSPPRACADFHGHLRAAAGKARPG